jgi:hypothetical protein
MCLTSFVNGPFLYVVRGGGPPGVVKQDDVVAAAQALYERVEGATVETLDHATENSRFNCGGVRPGAQSCRGSSAGIAGVIRRSSKCPALDRQAPTGQESDRFIRRTNP